MVKVHNRKASEGGVMRRLAKIAAIAAGGAVLLGVAVATPVLAAGPPSGVANVGVGRGMAGNGMGSGCLGSIGGNAVVTPVQALTDAQRTALARNASEEKLAHDLYEQFAARYDTVVFDHIAAAESNHLNAIRTLLNRYGIADPTANTAAGKFTDAAVQTSYDQLLTKGNVSQQAALEVGRTVETTDIDMLRTSLSGLTATDVQRVYTHLLAASQNHLAAFEASLGR